MPSRQHDEAHVAIRGKAGMSDGAASVEECDSRTSHKRLRGMARGFVHAGNLASGIHNARSIHAGNLASGIHNPRSIHAGNLASAIHATVETG